MRVVVWHHGNRYGRAIDRVHELAELIEQGGQEAELRLRIRQLEAAESRTMLIVQALTCFYTAVAGFVASTLVSLIGALLVSARVETGVLPGFALAFVAGTIGVFAMMTGALMLARETRFSFAVLHEERTFLTERVHERVTALTTQSPIQKT